MCVVLESCRRQERSEGGISPWADIEGTAGYMPGAGARRSIFNGLEKV